MGVACVARAGWLGSGSKVGSVLRFCGCERGAKSCCKKLIEQLVEMKLSFKSAGKRGGSKNLRWSVLEQASERDIYIYHIYIYVQIVAGLRNVGYMLGRSKNEVLYLNESKIKHCV